MPCVSAPARSVAPQVSPPVPCWLIGEPRQRAMRLPVIVMVLEPTLDALPHGYANKPPPPARLFLIVTWFWHGPPPRAFVSQNRPAVWLVGLRITSWSAVTVELLQ